VALAPVAAAAAAVVAEEHDDDDDDAPAPVRELTQTDHLNKRLLANFLQSMQGKSGAGTRVSSRATTTGPLCSCLYIYVCVRRMQTFYRECGAHKTTATRPRTAHGLTRTRTKMTHPMPERPCTNTHTTPQHHKRAPTPPPHNSNKKLI
jgi:hypothetical protein